MTKPKEEGGRSAGRPQTPFFPSNGKRGLQGNHIEEAKNQLHSQDNPN